MQVVDVFWGWNVQVRLYSWRRAATSACREGYMEEVLGAMTMTMGGCSERRLVH
jgi:hypothetical protein